ncbi:MAG: response regulator transcription factor [Mariniblastus sp.]|nr:response regulator transcription factor [Mariniblastus sp.]
MKSKPKHILVVEDEEHLAVGIKFNLEAEGFKVTTAGNGLSALKIIEDESEPVDLIVLDLMLPGMSGYEVCEQVRDNGRHMPILMLSARTLSEDRTRGFDVGASQYLVKPFELVELISRIKNLLSQFSNGQSKPPVEKLTKLVQYEFGEAKINFQTYEITVKDKPVRLTQLQIKVLKYFIEHEGVVIPRAKLLEDVWEMPGHMNTRAPDQILRQLRKTFEPSPSKPLHFLTIRDAGYRFVRNPEEKDKE